MPDAPGELSSPPLLLHTFGTGSLTAGPDGETLLGPGKTLALLIFLALAPGRRASREALIELLWSDSPPTKARNAIRQTLFHLRRLVGETAIEGTTELALVSPVATDRDQFLEALEAGALAAAIGLYTAPFLQGFGVPGGAAFEHWADLERDRLQAGVVRAAELLTRRYLDEGRLVEARQTARQLRECAPEVELARRLGLEVSLAARDGVLAAVEADALEQWAAREELLLEPKTRALIERARRPAATDATHDGERDAPSIVAELTGRAYEFSAITTAWQRVRTGPSRHLHISAPAGLGKTRLLQDAMSRLASSGATIVALRGTPGARDVPYAFAADLAAALVELPGAAGITPESSAALRDLNPALGARLSGFTEPQSGEDALHRRLIALADLMHAVADERRFVLVIDDLHWVDQTSMRLLNGLWARVHRAPILCLTASRPERAPVDERAEVLPLAPLTSLQVGALVGAIAALPPAEPWTAEFVAQLHRASAGSPLLIIETLRHALAEGVLALASDTWLCHDPPRLRAQLASGEALRARLRVLTEAQRDLLALLALIGTPVERPELSAMAGVPLESLPTVLEPLERQGLVTRVSGGVVPAHDELATAALAHLSDTARVAHHRRLDRYFTRLAEERTEIGAIVRAIRHAGLAGDQALVVLHFRRYVAMVRARGDRRPEATLAAELQADGATTVSAAVLVAGIPWSWRMGLWSRSRRAAAAFAACVLVAGPFALIARSQGVRAHAPRLVTVSTAREARVATLDVDHFDAPNVAVPEVPGDALFTEAALHTPDWPPVISPDGQSVAWTQDMHDRTTFDVWMQHGHQVRRLTQIDADDIVREWLPDGSALIGTTDRWRTPGSLGYDIARFDTATGAATPITRGPAHDTAPFVSPDGTRVVFMRETTDRPPQVCVTTIDGAREPECRLVEGNPVASVVGWTALDEVLLILDAPSSRPLVAYDWSRALVRPVLGPNTGHALLSRDRRWVVADVHVDGVRGGRRWIAPVDHPASARPLEASAAPLATWWEGPADRSLVIDRLAFADTVTTIPLGVGTRVRVHALNAAGSELAIRAPLEWSSSDSTIATVDSTGEVHARAAGVTTIRARLVGWRETSRAIRVVGEPASVVLQEPWDPAWSSRWIAWGDPQPVVVMGSAQRRGIWSRGDGVYPSFVLQRTSWPATRGLGVDVLIATPITSVRAQRLKTALVADVDTAALLRGDPRGAPASLGRSDALCGVTFPGFAAWGATRIALTSGASKEIDLQQGAQPLRSGAWWSLRIQIFPDGRCGVAVNGQALWISPEPLAIDGQFRLHLGDEALGAQLLHGPVTMWTGVRTDIAWSVPERQ
jgi:DNA-binding SARP family transcriptional activator